MQAWTTIPGWPGTGAVRDVPEPALSEGAVLVEAISIGVCGTDRDILAGQYGKAPQSSDYLILGHESLGRVVTAPTESGFNSGDLVVGVVRRPDPVPCANCAAGEWDMCRNGMYTERGIKLRHGFGSERFLGYRRILRVINRLRAKFGKPELEPPPAQAAKGR